MSTALLKIPNHPVLHIMRDGEKGDEGYIWYLKLEFCEVSGKKVYNTIERCEKDFKRFLTKYKAHVLYTIEIEKIGVTNE